VGASMKGRLRVFFRKILVCSCVTLLSGCVVASFSEGKPLPAERIEKIQIGDTTKTQILDWFGAPVGFSDSSSVESLLGDYELQPEDVLELPFADALVFRFTRGRLRARYLLVYVDAEVQVDAETLVVFFDRDDRVLYYGYSGALDAEEEAENEE